MKYTWTCPTCQNPQTVERGDEPETWPCQGSDQCTKRVCEQCHGPAGTEEDSQCQFCGLYACPEHLHSGEYDGERFDRICDICIAHIKANPLDKWMCPHCGESDGQPLYLAGRSPSRWYNGEEGDPGEEAFDGCTLCDPRKPGRDAEGGVIPEALALLGWDEGMKG